MSGSGAWYPLIPLLLGAVLVPRSVTAAPSLAHAIQKADAKYLDAKALETTGNTPRIEAGSGEEVTMLNNREIAQGQHEGDADV
jgi:hypothetical protein